jgi:hypothetical protein
MNPSTIKYCPACKKPMAFALPAGGRRTFRCLDCDRPDPLESNVAQGWLQGELGRKDGERA